MAFIGAGKEVSGAEKETLFLGVCYGSVVSDLLTCWSASFPPTVVYLCVYKQNKYCQDIKSCFLGAMSIMGLWKQVSPTFSFLYSLPVTPKMNWNYHNSKLYPMYKRTQQWNGTTEFIWQACSLLNSDLDVC